MIDTKNKFELKGEVNEKTCKEFFFKVNKYLRENNYECIDVDYFVESKSMYLFCLGYIHNSLIDKIKIFFYGNDENDLYISLMGEKIHLIKKIEVL